MHHHFRDWNKYNKELLNRAKIHFWINPNTLWKNPKHKKNGHPFVYADEAIIKAMLYIRFKFHLSLRERNRLKSPSYALKALSLWAQSHSRLRLAPQL